MVILIDIKEAITSRRSILQFQPRKVERTLLSEIFELSAWAPNHHRKEPWKIKVYENDSRITFCETVVESYLRNKLITPSSQEKLEMLKRKYQDFFTTVPHHALFYMDKEDDGGYLDDENFAAICAFIQNFQLVAWSKGVGTLWTAKSILRDEKYIRDLNLDPNKHKLIGVLHIGYPKKIPEAKPRTPMKDKMEWV